MKWLKLSPVWWSTLLQFTLHWDVRYQFCQALADTELASYLE